MRVSGIDSQILTPYAKHAFKKRAFSVFLNVCHVSGVIVAFDPCTARRTCAVPPCLPLTFQLEKALDGALPAAAMHHLLMACQEKACVPSFASLFFFDNATSADYEES